MLPGYAESRSQCCSMWSSDIQDVSLKLLRAILFKTVQVLKGKQYLTC